MMKTVLVLGAGASIPYGYPNGTQLMQRIAEQATKYGGHGVGISAECGQLGARLKDTSYKSIDAFLAKNPGFKELGKALISLELLKCENERNAQLFKDFIDETTGESFKRNEDWIRNHLGEIPEPLLENLVIVTFNYDRLLEHKLLTMWHADGIRDDELRARFNKLEILHIYGRLPLLQTEAFGATGLHTIEYGKWRSVAGHASTVEQLMKIEPYQLGEIRIIGENHEVVEKARKRMTEAERVIFLGWGFLEENVQLLGLNARTDLKNRAFGTIYNMPKTYEERILRNVPCLQKEKLFRATCAEMFYENHSLIP